MLNTIQQDKWFDYTRIFANPIPTHPPVPDFDGDNVYYPDDIQDQDLFGDFDGDEHNIMYGGGFVYPPVFQYHPPVFQYHPPAFLIGRVLNKRVQPIKEKPKMCKPMGSGLK